VYGLFDPGFGYTPERQPFRSVDDLRRIIEQHNLSEFVIKPASGEKGADVAVIGGRCGDAFVTLVGDELNLEEIYQSMLGLFNEGMPHRRETVILQERIRQHDLLQSINPHCTNTLRVITLINNSAEIEVLANQLKFGRGKAMVDNTSQGGVSCRVQEDSTLGPLIQHSREEFVRFENHPDTGARAAGLKLPYFREAVDLAIAAQRRFPQLRSIGWDIAITNDGPVIIEGNTWYGWFPQLRGRKGMITRGLREILDSDIMPKYRGKSAAR
jgi:hypothetical protein